MPGSATESWADLLRDCKRGGMRAPVLAVGDGALGFWAALREASPVYRSERDGRQTGLVYRQGSLHSLS